jgi:F-type H+-transporting ATPase subunit a
MLLFRLRSLIFVIWGLCCCPMIFADTSPAVSPKAYVLTKIFNSFPITNSMATTWVTSLIAILVVRLVMKKRASMVPGRFQSVLEVIVEGIQGVIEPIVGKRMVAPTFPILVGFFTFILLQNWCGLLPGAGAFGNYDAHHHFLYFFRPSNTDLNSTLGLAIASFLAWLFTILRYSGPKAIYHHIFGNKADKKEIPFFIYIGLFAVFFCVGFIECISILFRLVSLSFRLFGNTFGGESLVTSIYNLHHLIHNNVLSTLYRIFIPVPFFFLEALIGFIQAFVFTLLTAVYIGLICNHDEESEGSCHV